MLSEAVREQTFSEENRAVPFRYAKHTVEATQVPLKEEAAMPQKRKIPKGPIEVALAIYDCLMNDDDELAFVKGDHIVVTDKDPSGWWIGYLLSDPEKLEGTFPANRVQMTSEDNQEIQREARKRVWSIKSESDLLDSDSDNDDQEGEKPQD